MLKRLDGFILFLALLLANVRATMFVYLYPDTTVLLGPAWIEIALFFLAFIAAAYVLIRENQIKEYISRWRKNWLLLLFVLLAFVSILWSIGPVITLFRALELLFATLLAAYVGIRYRPSQLMEMLFWFGAVMLILSAGLAYGAPKTGTMYWAPFYGAWRGLFWHRNHLSSLTALVSIVFFCRLLIAIEKRQSTGLLDGVFYVLSVFVLVSAGSATGYILFIILHFCAICIWLWLRFAPRMQSQHYYAILGIFIAGAILILSNLGLVFGLFNRTSTLTGRVPLWEYLLRNIVSQRPWLGHGFGAAWALDAFREAVRLHVGWASQPLIGDNGFLDILIHVGLVGLVILLGILITGFVRSVKYGISHKTLADFFPLLIMIYAVFANISFSMFAETEVFVWFLIVVVLFGTMPATAISAEAPRRVSAWNGNGS